MQNNRQNYDFVYFNVMFLDGRWEDKRFGTAW
jgi:hypothetical protein